MPLKTPLTSADGKHKFKPLTWICGDFYTDIECRWFPPTPVQLLWTESSKRSEILAQVAKWRGAAPRTETNFKFLDCNEHSITLAILEDPGLVIKISDGEERLYQRLEGQVAVHKIKLGNAVLRIELLAEKAILAEKSDADWSELTATTRRVMEERGLGIFSSKAASAHIHEAAMREQVNSPQQALTA